MLHYARATQPRPRPDYLARFDTEDARDAFVEKDPVSRRPVDPPEDETGFHEAFVMVPGSNYGENVEVRAIEARVNFNQALTQ